MVSSNGKQHAAAEVPKSPYNQVREYVDRFEDWFPKYSYNSSTSTLIIQYMPSPMHESIASTIAEGFYTARSTLPPSLRTRIYISGNQEYCGFGGRYTGSNKTPDFAVEFEDAKGDVETKFVLEVGFSETYKELVQDAKMWLEGRRDVCVFVLANIEETPKYRCPVRHFDDEDFEQLGLPGFTELRTSDFNLEDEYGPATCKGFVWELLGTTAVPPIKFQLTDFLDISPESDCTINLNWDDYKALLRGRIKALAVFRCQMAMKERSGKENLRDQDYIPSDSSK
ncbi:MAG: hypothetical protein M1839_007455 [Geoglossum umbratile]|nr:MAG: hypothetical protein M1839_007455 [Geoglossum umbratile]